MDIYIYTHAHNPGSLKLPSKFKSTVSYSALPASPPPGLLRKGSNSKSSWSFTWQLVKPKPHQAKPHLVQEGKRKEQSPPRTQIFNRVEKNPSFHRHTEALGWLPHPPLCPLPFNKRLLKRPPSLLNGYTLTVRSKGFSNQLSPGPLFPCRQWVMWQENPGPQRLTTAQGSPGIFPPSLGGHPLLCTKGPEALTRDGWAA